MRTVDVTHIPQYGAGVNGFYCRLTQRKGIKVRSDLARFDESRTWVLKEYEALCAAQHSGVSPKPYEVVLVNNNGRKHYGIIMEHITGRTLSELVDRQAIEDSRAAEIEYKLIHRLEKMGIYHNDLCSNWDNIIIQKKNGRMKAIAIDFGNVDYES